MKREWNYLIAGIIIGVVFFVIFSRYFGYGGDSSLLEGESVKFTNYDVHLDTTADFAGGVIPSYDGEYCAKKYGEIYESEAKSCNVLGIRTVARINPVVKEVDCSCRD